MFMDPTKYKDSIHRQLHQELTQSQTLDFCAFPMGFTTGNVRAINRDNSESHIVR